MANEANKNTISKRRFLTGLGTVAAVGTGSLATLSTASAQTPPSTPVYINARDYGAVGNATANDFLAIQAAPDAAGAAGGAAGGIVFLPAGRYYVNGWGYATKSLVIPPNVTLAGVTEFPLSVGMPTDFVSNPKSGTVLLADGGAGQAEGDPLVILRGPNSGIRSMAVYYPYQDWLNPVAYPWTIRGEALEQPGVARSKDAHGLSVVNVMLVNSYRGIDFGTNGCVDHRIENIYGQPLKTGIRIDKGYANGRIKGVQFWSYWDKSRATLTPSTNQYDYALSPWVRDNGVALEIYRADSELVEDFFCFGYKTAILLSASSGRDSGNSYVTFSNVSIDCCKVGIEIVSNRLALITNFVFASPRPDDPNLSSFVGLALRVGGAGDLPPGVSRYGAVQIANGNFYGGDSHQIIVHYGRLTVGQSAFSDWPADRAAVYAESVFSEIYLQSCRFNPRGAENMSSMRYALYSNPLNPVSVATGTGNYFGGNAVVVPGSPPMLSTSVPWNVP